MIDEKTNTIVPHVNFRVRELGEWVDKNTDDYFKDKKVPSSCIEWCASNP